MLPPAGAGAERQPGLALGAGSCWQEGLQPRHEVERQQGLPGTGAAVNGGRAPGAARCGSTPQGPRLSAQERAGGVQRAGGDWETLSTCFSPKVFLQERAFVKLEHKYT